MSSPKTPSPRFAKGTNPGSATEAIARIVDFVLQAISEEPRGKLAAGFDRDKAIGAWTHQWGAHAQNHFDAVPGAWEKEWLQVSIIATVQGVRAVDIAGEAGHDGVHEDDFLKGGFFAARCCKNRFYNLGPEFCWCDANC